MKVTLQELSQVILCCNIFLQFSRQVHQISNDIVKVTNQVMVIGWLLAS